MAIRGEVLTVFGAGAVAVEAWTRKHRDTHTLWRCHLRCHISKGTAGYYDTEVTIRWIRKAVYTLQTQIDGTEYLSHHWNSQHPIARAM